MGAPIKADDLWGQWARQQWKAVYLFSGQEDFLIEAAIQKAIDHWLGGRPDPLQLDKLDAAIQPLEDILQAAHTVPFFGSRRVLVIHNVSQLSPKEQERLSETLTTLDRETPCLLVWGREWRRDDAQRPLIEAVSKLGQIVIFWPLFPAQAERWLTERAKLYKKNLHAQAAHWLIQQSGEGLRLLDHELAKCATYVGEAREINLEDVQASFGYSKAASPFEWIASIRKQDLSRALAVLDELMEGGEEPLRLLALASRSLREWLDARNSDEPAAVLAMRFHIRKGEENRFLQELSRWSMEDLTESLSLCLEAEESIKSGKEMPEMSLTLLTLGLCRSEGAYAGRQS